MGVDQEAWLTVRTDRKRIEAMDEVEEREVTIQTDPKSSRRAVLHAPMSLRPKARSVQGFHAALRHSYRLDVTRPGLRACMNESLSRSRI